MPGADTEPILPNPCCGANALIGAGPKHPRQPAVQLIQIHIGWMNLLVSPLMAQAYLQGLQVRPSQRKSSSQATDWVLLEANFESVETRLALNMYSPNAVYACKTYMLVKDGCTCCLMSCSYLQCTFFDAYAC